MNTSIETYNFHGDSLDIIRDGQDLFVSLRRACEALGIHEEPQRRKLQSKPWAVTTMKEATGPDGKSYESLCVHLDSLPMWLATIEPSRVKEEVRPKLLRFQTECARVLRDHFYGPLVAVNDNALDSRLDRIEAHLRQLSFASIQPPPRQYLGERDARIIRAKLLSYACILASDKKERARLRAGIERDVRNEVSFSAMVKGNTWAFLEPALAPKVHRFLDLRLSEAHEIRAKQCREAAEQLDLPLMEE